MNPEQYAALIRASLARLDYISPRHAEQARAELGLGLALAEVMGRGLVRELTRAGQAALTFTFGQLSTAIEEAAIHQRLTEIADDIAHLSDVPDVPTYF